MAGDSLGEPTTIFLTGERIYICIHCVTIQTSAAEKQEMGALKRGQHSQLSICRFKELLQGSVDIFGAISALTQAPDGWHCDAETPT